MEIRAAVPGDAWSINQIYDHYVRTSHATFDIETKDLAWRSGWLAEHAGERHPVIVALDAGHVVGYASSSPYRSRPAYEATVETSVYVHHEHTGRAIGAALYSALFEALEREDLHRAVAGIAVPNPASVALHERFGFARVGRFTEQGWKFGRYWDVDWYERPLAASKLAAW